VEADGGAGSWPSTGQESVMAITIVSASLANSARLKVSAHGILHPARGLVQFAAFDVPAAVNKNKRNA
jgi:hypothetical protein